MAEGLWRSDPSAKFILQEAKEGKWRRSRSMRGEVREGKDEKWIAERYNNNNNNNNNNKHLGMVGAWLPKADGRSMRQ
jgi:hypothetical protein